MGFPTGAVIEERLESEPEGEGEIERFVKTELDLGGRVSWWWNQEMRGCRSGKASIVGCGRKGRMVQS